MRIIENRDGACDGQIFNLGTPGNECSIKELAERLVAIYEAARPRIPRWVPPRIETVAADAYYGRGYQDIEARRPSIDKAQRVLGWNPSTSLHDALVRTFDSFLEEWLAADAARRVRAGEPTERGRGADPAAPRNPDGPDPARL